MLVGPTNCGKSFLLNPIELMYNCFVNPASGKYAWVGLDEKEVAYLNDLRWTEELIRWCPHCFAKLVVQGMHG